MYDPSKRRGHRVRNPTTSSASTALASIGKLKLEIREMISRRDDLVFQANKVGATMREWFGKD